jgi:hypothetical protein
MLDHYYASLLQVAKRAQYSARPSCQCGAMRTVIEHTFSPSHHHSSVQGTRKAAKMPARFVEFGTLFPYPGIHFHGQELTKFEKKNMSY